MRMRNRAHLDERIDACCDITLDGFKNEAARLKPLHIEIGCGKGGFITQTALLNPDINYIAVEKVSNVIVLAMEKAKALIPILVPLFISAFRRADELATAMECRCYQGGEGRTKMKLLRYTLWDFEAFGISALVLGAIFALRAFGL